MKVRILSVLPIVTLFLSCNHAEKKHDKENNNIMIQEQTVGYAANGVSMRGFIAFDTATKEKRPAVLIVPEWWGLNDYAKGRARQLAALGYVAMAIDMYGDGRTADSPDSAGKLAMPFYSGPQMAKDRFDAALEKLKQYDRTDTSRIAAIGYCFGGSMVLNMAKLGDDLRGVVSFHGDLNGVPANKDLLKARILVCHGMDDKFVSAQTVANFKRQMDSIKADYVFKEYPDATHAFTNPAATATGKKFNIPIAYNAAADTASWNEMKMFFDKIFQ